MRLFRCPHRIFITSLRWPRYTVEMQGIELVAIFSLLSSLFSLFSAPSLLLSSAIDQRNRISAFLQGIMRHRGRPPCRNAVIRDDSGANTPCCQSSWGPLAAFFCDFFFLLSSRISLSCYTRESANPVAVQLQCSCSLFLQGFDGGCSSRPPPPPQQTLWGPLAASWVVLKFPRWLFCLSWAEPESIVSFAAVAVCGAFSVLLSWNLASGHRRRPQLLRPFAAPTNPAVSQFGDLWRPFL